MIRLADRQGILKRPSLGKIQQWALMWLVVEEERLRIEEKDTDAQFQLWVIDPDRWKKVYHQIDDEDQAHAVEVFPDELAKLDHYLKTLNDPREVQNKDLGTKVPGQ
jgi:hypothetical protein